MKLKQDTLNEIQESSWMPASPNAMSNESGLSTRTCMGLIRKAQKRMSRCCSTSPFRIVLGHSSRASTGHSRKISTRENSSVVTHGKRPSTISATTKECAKCGVETAKSIWVREHSCPSCGFEADRDANAAMNVLKRGFTELGLGWPEDTPVETALPTDTDSVSAKRVVEAGSLEA